MQILQTYLKRVSVSVAALLVAGSGLAFFTPASKASAAPGCQDVLSIFARGSQEPQDQNFNSAESSKFASELTARFSGLRYSQVDLGNIDGDFVLEPGEYPAVGRSQWQLNNGMQGYYDSLNIGINELVNFVSARIQQCPNESIILGGYSQGADLIGYMLDSATPSTLDHIGYAALYGDPRFNSCGNAWWAHGNFNGCTVGSVVIYGGNRSPYLPDGIYGRAGSWCDIGDGICTANTACGGVYPCNHGSIYNTRWITDSADVVASAARTKAYELNPSLLANTRIGALSEGTYLAKEGGLTAPWVTESTGDASIAMSGNRMGVLTSTGSLYVKAGAIDATWVLEKTGVSSFALSGTRIAAIAGGTLYVKDGSLSREWSTMRSGVSSVSLSGNRIGILSGGSYIVQEGDLNAPWVTEWNGAVDGTIDGNRIAIIASDATLYVKEGSLGAAWVPELSSTTSIALSGSRIGAVAYGNNLYVKEGNLYAGWVQELDHVTTAVLSGDRIGALYYGNNYLVKQGNLYAPWVTELNGGVSKIALSQ